MIVFVVSAGLVGAIALLEIETASDLIHFQSRFTASGGWIGVASDKDAGLSAQRCDALARLPAVVSAGGFTRGGTVRITSAPGTIFASGWATPGAIRVWADEPPLYADLAGGLVLGSDAAAETGLSEGMSATILGVGSRQVSVVVGTSARNPAIARWFLESVAPVAGVEECWVEFTPGSLDAGLGLMEATFAGAGSGLDVRPLRTLDEFSRDPGAELASRPHRNLWMAVGVVLALLVWLSVWMRTSEIGLYRAMGSSSTTLWLLGQSEVIATMVPGAAIGFLWAWAWEAATASSVIHHDVVVLAARSALSALLLALCLGPLGWLVLGRGHIAAQLKD